MADFKTEFEQIFTSAGKTETAQLLNQLCRKQIHQLTKIIKSDSNEMVVPYLAADIEEPQVLVASIKERRGGFLLNLDRILLYSAGLATGWGSFFGNLRRGLSLDAQLRELAIC